LTSLLAGRGVYAEAADGRPVFILPWESNVLIGTTDLPFEGDPSEAVAEEAEIDYLLAAVNDVLPQARLARNEIDFHYSGVRPLPFADAATPAAITRRHALHWHAEAPLPLCSVIGGKLTTCRSLAEEAAAEVLARLGRSPTADSRDRTLPGGHEYPPDEPALATARTRLARENGLSEGQVRAVWPLVGNRLEELFRDIGPISAENLPGTELPVAFAQWAIEHEWVTTLADLVERRLMLLFHAGLSRSCCRKLADLLVAAGKLPAHLAESEVEALIEGLRLRYGKRVVDA
jgi:glycerol-3-phosphate dehydrogenase